MQKHLPYTLAVIMSILCVSTSVTAQNGSPYWSTFGNSNATSSSKLGTTNGINLRLFTNNAERVRILYTNGFVGIGTTTPNARLHFDAPSGTSLLRGTVAGSTKLYMSSAGGLTVGAGLAAPANGLYVAGKVGIGTNTPTAKLQVVGNASIKTTDYNTSGLEVTNTGASAVYANGYTYGIYGIGGNAGVYGQGRDGVYGVSTVRSGVYGQGPVNGVMGYSANKGVYGEGTYGVYGYSTYSGGDGVHGTATALSGYGVYANSTQSYGIYASTGNSASYAGFFGGNVYTSGSYLPSDRMLKQDIADVTSAMDILNKLQPKTYHYKQDGSYKLMNLPTGKRYGLIAQDVEQVLPEMVKVSTFEVGRASSLKADSNATASQPSQSIAFKALNYTELIPIIIKGMQEQEAENKALREENKDIKERLAKLEAILSNNNNSLTFNSALLDQNTPNPVSSSATIRYHIPESVSSARLDITNAKGQLVKTITIGSRGTGQIQLNIQAFASGTYNYTLYVDGKQVDTKRLIIVK
jgi:hypothetical protein